jgi:ligand-binding SRPBCC domain-containing protein
MPTIILRTQIDANQQLVFDLARSIDLHKISTEKTNEEAIAGITSGLIELNETVTWRARHFGVYQTLTSKITEFDAPNYFVDEMVKGAFKSFRHEHIFKTENGKTIMDDIFDFEVPFGVLGSLVGVIILKPYLKKFLLERNQVIKSFAETEKYNTIL